MIVCLCHRVSDRDIRRSVESGVRNFDVLQDETRVASACGCCHECAVDVFESAVSTCPGTCRIDDAGQLQAQKNYPVIELVRA